jgi:acetyl esterase/lipase
LYLCKQIWKKAMKATKLILIMTTLIAMTASVTGKTYPLWPKGAPNNNGNPTDTAKVSVFLPDAKKATGRAVVICPGGGYGFLAMEHEGTDWAPFFNREGIAVIVLKYRMPHGNYEIPISDA